MRCVTISFLFLSVLFNSAYAQSLAPLPLKLGGQYTGGCGTSHPLPGDATAISWSAGGDVCALKQSWCNGKPLFDIIVGGNTYTINSVNCFPDVRKLASLLGISPVFGRAGAPLSKLYDQLGGTSGFVQATSANRPAIWLINGIVSIAFDGFLVDFGSGSQDDRFLNFPSITTNNQNTTAYAAIQASSSCASFGYGSAGDYPVLFSTSPAGATGFSVQTNIPNPLGAFSWVSVSAVNTGLWLETQPAVIGVIASSGAFTMTQNEESGAGAALASGTATGGTLGAINFFSQKSGFFGRMYGFVIAGAIAATSGQQIAMRNAFYGLHNIAKATPKYSILIDGASVDAGVGSLIGGINGYGWAEQMLAFLPYPIRTGNTSVQGAKILDLNGTVSAFQCNFFQATGTNVLIGPGFAAGNSISGGKTGAQTYADLVTYLTSIKACSHAPTIIMVYLLASSGSDAENDYNVLVIANAATLGITPIGGGPAGGYQNTIMSQFQVANAQYFNQSPAWIASHPTIVGYQNMSLPPLAAIQRALGP